jgi:UDP-N-acetylglucosamine 4,6-dehydratase/5-epimerase
MGTLETKKITNMKRNSIFNGKSVLITGGTGSFGQAFIKKMMEEYDLKKLIIYSRDEYKQYQLNKKYNKENYPPIRYFLGDVRDEKRLERALNDIDIVIHAAALKQVPAAEYNPDEFIKTNIGGAQNVISAALNTNVKAVVALSTDKAAAPLNLYGATKLVSDKLFIAANNIKGDRNLKFSVVRYGNVLGSRGSVIPFFLEKSKTGVIPITDENMTRFNMSLDAAVESVIWSVENCIGGEILVPKLKSFKLSTLAHAISNTAKTSIIGLRPGEKLHEEMITSGDSYNTVDIGGYYLILPQGINIDNHLKHHGGVLVKPGFNYASDTNTEWITEGEMKKLINQYVNENI